MKKILIPMVLILFTFFLIGCPNTDTDIDNNNDTNTGPVITIPAAPIALTATVQSDTAISLTWTDNSNNETGFVLEWDTDSTFGSPDNTNPAVNTTSFEVTTLNPSTEYFFRVKAVNSAGSSAYSETSAATNDPPITIPAAPGGLTATSVSSSSVNLSWTDNSDNESGFSIERSTISGNTGFAQLTTVSANISTHNDTTVSAGSTFWYRVRAYNSNGNSVYSNVYSATPISSPDTTAPTVPTGLNASAVSASQINLSWNASTDNVGVTGYNIYRGGSYLKSVSGTSTSDTGLSPSTTYTYRVSAYDAAGNVSSQSTSDSATTQALNYTFNGGTIANLRAVSPSLIFGTLTINGVLEIPETESSVTFTVANLDINASIDVDNDTSGTVAYNCPDIVINASGTVWVDASVKLNGETGKYNDPSGSDGGDLIINAANIYVNSYIDTWGGLGIAVSGIGYDGGAGGNITLNAAGVLQVSSAGADFDLDGGSGAWGSIIEGSDGNDGTLNFEGSAITIYEISGEINMYNYNAQLLDYERMTLYGATWLGEEISHRNTFGAMNVWYNDNSGNIIYDWIEDLYLLEFSSGWINLSLTASNSSADLDLFLLDSEGTLLYYSNGATSTESIAPSISLNTGKYYVGVSYSDWGVSASTNYTLNFNQ